MLLTDEPLQNVGVEGRAIRLSSRHGRSEKIIRYGKTCINQLNQWRKHGLTRVLYEGTVIEHPLKRACCLGTDIWMLRTIENVEGWQ
jgi:hypothetical protein